MNRQGRHPDKVSFLLVNPIADTCFLGVGPADVPVSSSDATPSVNRGARRLGRWTHPRRKLSEIRRNER